MSANKLARLLIPVMCLPCLVHAQVYKCQAPNGPVSFQDHPCPQGTAGSSIDSKPAQGHAAKPPPQVSGAVSRAASSSGAAQYPYARGDDLKRLKAENAELQAMNARMKKDNPNWQHSQTLTRLNAQAEALNERIK